MEKRILLASPRGFCFGVERAVRMLEDAIRREPGTVYVRQEIVHNTALVERFKALGAVVVDEVDQVPEGGVVVFSAHGVPPSVREQAARRRLRVVDTTCPMVDRVHREAVRLRERGYTIVLIGRAGHKEVLGIMGEAPEHIRFIQDESGVDGLCGIDGAHVAWLSQTTLNVDETMRIVRRLREKYPLLLDPPHACICRATRDRQLAVRSIAGACDLFVVVGSAASSNTQRLAEVALSAGAARAVRVDEPEELDGVDFSAVWTVGVSSGVSAADGQLARVLSYLKKLGFADVEERPAVSGNEFAGRP